MYGLNAQFQAVADQQAAINRDTAEACGIDLTDPLVRLTARLVATSIVTAAGMETDMAMIGVRQWVATLGWLELMSQEPEPRVEPREKANWFRRFGW